jgi:hypothetical protein
MDRLELSRRRAYLVIAAYRLTAVIKLVNLMTCDKEVTARQACLDVLGMKWILEDRGDSTEEESPGHKPVISQQKAAELMQILAGTKQTNEKD